MIFACSPLLRGAEADSTTGYTQGEIAAVGMDMRNGSPVVVLRDQKEGRLLPIWVGTAEARAIAISLAGIELPRPMTHDLMRLILEETDLKLREVRIDKVENNTFFARLMGTRESVADGASKEVEIDSRPSDAMALALRMDVPILLSEALLNEIPDFDFSTGGSGVPGAEALRVLGLRFQVPSSESLENAGLKSDSGALQIVEVPEGMDQKLEPGDLVSEADGAPIDGIAGLIRMLRGKAAEEQIELRIHRGDEEWKVSLPILEQPRSEPAPTLEESPPRLSV